VQVTGQQQDEMPWRFLKIHVHYVVRGRGLKEKAVRDAIELSEQKYGSVSATLCDVVELTYDYQIVDESLSLRKGAPVNRLRRTAGRRAQ
jgi:putative redox protein